MGFPSAIGNPSHSPLIHCKKRKRMQPNCASIYTSSISNIRNEPVIKHKNARVLSSDRIPEAEAAGFRSLMIDTGGGSNGVRSAGPIKFVVNEDDIISMVIDTALKMYAREGRLPVLGSDVGNFLLYPVNAGSDALNLSETIGSSGGRNFVLCKKQNNPQMTDARSDMVAKKGNNGWKTWLNKSFVFNASSH